MKKLLILFVFVALTTSCFHTKKIVQQPLAINHDSTPVINNAANEYLNYEAYYYHTGEATYEEVQIKNGKLTYTTFNAEKKSNNTHGVDQTTDWSKENLITKEAILTKPDIDSLFAKVERHGYWKLDTAIGNPTATERFYPFELSFKTMTKEKDVLFKSVPGGVSMPDAFRKSRDLLSNLVREKFK